MEQEEAGEPELADQRELLVAVARVRALVTVRARVALVERALADARSCPIAASRSRRRSRGSGSRAPASGRTAGRSASSAVRCDGVAVVGEALEHRLRRQRGRTRGCRAARARSRRARCGSGSRRARPGARRAARGARARRRSRPSARRASRRARRARRCRRASPRSYGRWSSTKNRSRRTRARAGQPRSGLYAPSPCRAQPERQTRPVVQLQRVSCESRARAAAARGPRLRARAARAPA